VIAAVERVLLLVLACACALGVAPAQRAPAPQPESRPASRETPDLVILHLNDFHGQILPRELVGRDRKTRRLGGFEGLARYVADERARAVVEAVWVTNGGDWFQGTPEGNEAGGRHVVELFARLGCAASVVGNHEYDFGERNVVALVAAAREPVLGANVFAPNGARRGYVRPWCVRVARGVRIALVGLVTADTKNVSTGPFHLEDERDVVQFADEAATVAACLRELDGLADAVVLITHCGVETDRELARRFPSVPLILGGHSHTALANGLREGGTWIVQSAGKGTAVSRVELAVTPERPHLRVLRAGLVDVPAVAPEDPRADEALRDDLERRFGHLRAQWDTPIGSVEGDPDDRSGPGSTPAGNLLAGLIREAGEARIGLTNKGGIRTTLPSGPLTRRHVYELLPFENTVVTFELTGAQLRAVLQESLRKGRRPLEIDGATYSYRIVDGERLLVDVMVSGASVVDTHRYPTATNSFLASGGDGFHVFLQARRLRENPRLLRDLLLARLAEDPVLRLRAEERVTFVP
jgi:2',3'-cyclic-nucleotide 2'-phosphodiesterase (5'-nucleotidase family)